MVHAIYKTCVVMRMRLQRFSGLEGRRLRKKRKRHVIKRLGCIQHCLLLLHINRRSVL